MWMSWVSRGQVARLRQDPQRAKASTRNYQVVELGGTEYWRLPEAGLKKYQHVLTVTIKLGYYGDNAALGWRHPIPRYLRPTRTQ